MNERKAIVVTGGAGFIGANLCRQLLETPGIGSVVAFDDLSSGNPRNLDGTKTELVVGSILDTHELDPVLEQADAIVHLAARPSVARSVADPLPSHLVNASGTVNVLEGARRDGGRQIIVASSSSVYGANPQLPKHEGLATRPISPYAASKLATEAYTLAYGHSYNLPALAFRFFNVFGPLQAAGHAYAAVVPAFLDAALRRQPLSVHGDGTQSRDFTYVGTVTSVITDAIIREVSHLEPVNLAFGTRTTLLSVIEMLAEILDQELELQHTENRAGDVPHSQASGDLVAELFPSVQPKPLHDGLQTTADWMRSTLLPA